MRAALARDRRELRGVDVARHRLALLAHAAVVIDAQIAADADEPGLEVRAPIERVQRLEDLEEDVLRQILGFVVPADELVGQVEDLAPMLAHDLIPGGLIAGEAPLDERVRGLAGEVTFSSADIDAGRGAGIIAKSPATPPRRVQSPDPVAGFHHTGGGLTCDDVHAGGRRARGRHARPRLQRESHRGARRPRSTRAFAGYPHRLHYAIKANATLAVVRAPAGARRRRRRQLRRRDRGRPARGLRAWRHRLHGRRQDARGARSRRGAGRPRDQRGVARRSRSHRGDRARARHARARGRAHQPGRRRAKPPAHFDRHARDEVRHVDRRRARDGARHVRAGRISRSSGCTCTSDRK